MKIGEKIFRARMARSRKIFNSRVGWPR